jgi:PAS domain S-box-containing protein
MTEPLGSEVIFLLSGNYNKTRLGELVSEVGFPASDGDRGPADRERLFVGRSELAGLMRRFDWGGTAIGVPERWPQSLKAAVRIMLASPQPISIGWGSELIHLYNDPYKSIIGGKHPWALGRPTSVVWSEIWQDIAPRLTKVLGGEEGSCSEAQLLIIERDGLPEETYHTFSYSPIPADDGSPGGIFCASTDDTQRLISERQLSLLRELASRAAEPRSVKQACERCASALMTDPLDLPFAMVYMTEPGGQVAQLMALSGIDPNHHAVKPSLRLDSGAGWPLAEVVARHTPCLVTNLREVFACEFPSGGWRQAPAQAVVLPVASSSEAGRSGFVIAGLNPFQRYDERYARFLELVAGQIAAAVKTAEAHEEQRRHAEALAEIDRAKTAFFSNVSHELRTPLTLMLSPLEEVLAKELDSDSRSLLGIAHRSGVRLLSFVNTLLDSSRIDTAPAPVSTRVHAQADEGPRWLGSDSTRESPPPSSEGLQTDVSGAAEHGERILLVDDDADMRDYVRRLLTGRYTVETVGDGQAALQAAWRQRPDLVLSDVMMPRLDGFSLLQALRNDVQLRDVPVIFLSARAGEEARVEGLEAGADDYLSKPFSARELMARVRVNIEMATLRREAVRVESVLRLEAQTAQERAEAILASINDGFFALDGEWRFTYVNAAAERLLNRSAQELLGKSHWEEYPPTVGTELEAHYRRAMDERLGAAFEYYFAAWNRWFDIRVYPAQDGGISVYFRGITKRKRVEAALRDLNERLELEVSDRTAELQAQAARLRAIFATSYSYQGFVAVDGTLLDANATSLSGIDAALEDVVGKSFWDTPWFTGTPGLPEVICAAVSAVAAGETMRQEIRVNLPVGGWRWFDFQMRPVRDDEGRVVAIVPEAVELTERRKAEEAFRQAQKMEAIGQLTGGVAHDFNNLLTVIRSSADLLRRRDLPADRARRYVDAISDTADRAAKLTGQLLAFARRHALNLRVFDAVDQVELVADMLRTVLGSRASFELDIAERPLPVEADANQFETALVNLVANSRDAMDGRGLLTIRIAKSTGPRHDAGDGAVNAFVAVAISDTGCGIPSDQIDRIFEPFFTTKDVGRGTGLGLSQVYGFAQQSGGTVRVASEVGVGTTITLYLPLSSKSIQHRQRNLLPSGEARERWNILVVEDNAEVGEFSTQLLHDLGYHPILAQNAEEALKLLEQDPEGFDIVLSDVVMPGLDGVSLGREIRRRLPSLPFVLNSGYSYELADGADHGFDLLQKPYSVEELSRVLRRAMANRSRVARPVSGKVERR